MSVLEAIGSLVRAAFVGEGIEARGEVPWDLIDELAGDGPITDEHRVRAAARDARALPLAPPNPGLPIYGRLR